MKLLVEFRRRARICGNAELGAVEMQTPVLVQ